MEIKTSKGSWHDKNIRLLARGEWSANQLIVWPLLDDKKKVKIFRGLTDNIQQRWKELRNKSPRIFDGPVFRLVDYYEINRRLVLDVLPSSYKEGQVLGVLGISMIPLTSDGYLILQASVANLVPIFGQGIRSPGCTPDNRDFVKHTIKELYEEMGVVVSGENLTFVGLVEARYSSFRYLKSIVAKVKIKETLDELLALSKSAKDRWEGELVPLRLRKKIINDVMYDKKYSKIARLIIALVAQSEMGHLGIEIVE